VNVVEETFSLLLIKMLRYELKLKQQQLY